MAPLYDYECSECGEVLEVQHLIAGPTQDTELPEGVAYDGDADALFHDCGEDALDGREAAAIMVKLISPVRGTTIVKGNGDFRDRQRERLEKRSQDHWKRQGRRDAVERAISKGHYVPPQWIKQETSRIK